MKLAARAVLSADAGLLVYICLHISVFMAAQYGKPLYFTAVVSILSLAYSQRSQIACVPYIHTSYGVCAI